MSAYTKPIIRFGLIMPAAFNLVMLGAALAGVNKLSQVRAAKEARYKEYTARLQAIKALDEHLAPRRKVFEDQKHILQADPAQLFTRILDTMLPKYKDFELERSSLVFPQDRGRIGKHVHADVARVKSSFEGGIGPMQEALLQLESLMPQAMLEDIRVTRKADLLLNKPEHLLVEMTHACIRAGEGKP